VHTYAADTNGSLLLSPQALERKMAKVGRVFYDDPVDGDPTTYAQTRLGSLRALALHHADRECTKGLAPPPKPFDDTF
jgi:hypothetical protein